MSTPLTAERLAEIRAELDYAGKELGEICKEGPSRRWRMRIPANADDSDLVLSAAIVAGEELLAEVARLRERDARIHEELRDRRTDDLNVRGILSPQPGTGPDPEIPFTLGPQVAPAVEWLVAEVERLRTELARLRADVAEEHP